MADQPAAQNERPPASPQDKALAADWRKRIEAALQRKPVKEAFARFERNRSLLRGMDPDEKKQMRSNLYFANLAALRPQVYAKDPEYAVRPTKAVPEVQLEKIRQFCETAETLLTELLVKRAKLKKRAKRILTAAFTTSIGWWKVGWQEDKRTDPLYENQIKDTQDNLMRLETQRRAIDEPNIGTNVDLQIAQLRETLAGLQKQAEVKVARGVLLDFVMSEDIVIIDPAVREFGDYERAGALAHRVWMSRAGYKERFKYDCKGGRSYSEIGAQPGTGTNTIDNKSDLLCVWEVWDQESNRIFHVCEGEEGFCDEPSTPDWTAERWYPFFGLAFNEIDGTFYPLSDIELTEPLVKEYNKSRDDFVRDRKDVLPFTIVRKGGSLTPTDVDAIRNRQGNDIMVVEGVGGQKIGDDIQAVTLGQLNPENYNTQPARADIEQIIGGGDAARGSVLEAKTATEAEILSQGLRGRSAERQDTMEDLLTELGTYALQMFLRKLSLAEVQAIAGAEAVWPQLTADEVFKLVTVEVRGGSTGKPDRLQEQDRWTKLLPVIKEALAQVAELRANGGNDQAQAVIALVKETLRRFDERLDIDQFLPAPKKGETAGPPDPMQDPRIQQMVQQAQELIQSLQQQVQELEQKVADKSGEQAAKVRQAEIDAQKAIDTARITAPINAEAQIESARVKAEADAAAQVEIARMNAANAPPPPEPAAVTEGPTEQQQIAQRVDQLSQGLEAMDKVLSQLQQVQSQPRPLMKVVHERDPKTNAITQSRMVPDEQMP